MRPGRRLGFVGAVATLGVAASTSTALAAPPAPSLAPEIAAVINATTPNVTLSASGAAGYWWQLDNGPVSNSNTVNLAIVVDGAHTLRAVAFDQFGFQSPQTVRNFRMDRTPPANPQITPDLPALTNNPPSSVTISGGGEPVGYQWQLDGAAVRTEHTVSLSGLGDGTHTLTFRAVDEAGNPSAWVTRTMRIDRTAPSAPNVSPEVSSTTAITSLPTLTLSGGGETVTYRWQIDQGAVQTGATVTAGVLKDGQHQLTVWSVDAAGNSSTKAIRSFKIDTAPRPTTTPGAPKPPSLTPSQVAPAKTPPTVTATTTGGETVVWSLSGPRVLSGLTPSPATPSLAGLPDGDYTLTARARNAGGALSVPATMSFRIDSTPPAAPKITSGPGSARGGPAPLFTWTGEPGGSYIWRVTRGDVVVQGPAATTERAVRLAPTAIGDGYQFTVNQLDAVGNTGPTGDWTFAIGARVAGKPGSANPQLLAKAFGPLYPRAGKRVSDHHGVMLRWVYRAGRPTKLFNVQVYDGNRRKVFSMFTKKQAARVPSKFTEGGQRYYWQVWPYWGKERGYGRRPLGISNFRVNAGGTIVSAERRSP